MALSYSKHTIGPEISELSAFEFAEYNPNDLAASEEASNEALKNYLSNDSNRKAFNDSYAMIRSEYYSGNDVSGTYDAKNDKLESLYSFSASSLPNSNDLAVDVLQRLKDNDADFAYYILNDYEKGTELTSIVTESGSSITVDPAFSSGMLGQFAAGAMLAGAFFPQIFYGYRNYKKKSKEKTKLFKWDLHKFPSKNAGIAQMAIGIGSTSWFAGNMIYSGALYSSANYIDKMLGIKGLCYNSSFFLFSNGAYNILSGINDLSKNNADKDAKIRSGLKIGAGALEEASGYFFYKAATEPMTSLIYEGSGIFSISTKGLAGILSNTLPLAGGLLLGAALLGGAYAYRWYKNKSNQGMRTFDQIKKNSWLK